jgi:hypothetical protein
LPAACIPCKSGGEEELFRAQRLDVCGDIARNVQRFQNSPHFIIRVCVRLGGICVCIGDQSEEFGRQFHAAFSGVCELVNSHDNSFLFADMLMFGLYARSFRRASARQGDAYRCSPQLSGYPLIPENDGLQRANRGKLGPEQNRRPSWPAAARRS